MLESGKLITYENKSRKDQSANPMFWWRRGGEMNTICLQNGFSKTMMCYWKSLTAKNVHSHLIIKPHSGSWHDVIQNIQRDDPQRPD